jgi:hypothetical protein
MTRSGEPIAVLGRGLQRGFVLAGRQVSRRAELAMSMAV